MDFLGGAGCGPAGIFDFWRRHSGVCAIGWRVAGWQGVCRMARRIAQCADRRDVCRTGADGQSPAASGELHAGSQWCHEVQMMFSNFYVFILYFLLMGPTIVFILPQKIGPMLAFIIFIFYIITNHLFRCRHCGWPMGWGRPSGTPPFVLPTTLGWRWGACARCGRRHSDRHDVGPHEHNDPPERG